MRYPLDIAARKRLFLILFLSVWLLLIPVLCDAVPKRRNRRRQDLRPADRLAAIARAFLRPTRIGAIEMIEAYRICRLCRKTCYGNLEEVAVLLRRLVLHSGDQVLWYCDIRSNGSTQHFVLNRTSEEFTQYPTLVLARDHVRFIECGFRSSSSHARPSGELILTRDEVEALMNLARSLDRQPQDPAQRDRAT